MRVLALFTLLTALAAPAAARSHPRRQCKAKHTPAVRPTHIGGNNQLNQQPNPSKDAEQPAPTVGTDSAVLSKPQETPEPAPEEPTVSPSSAQKPAASSSEATPSPTSEPAPSETPEPAPGSEADKTPEDSEAVPSETPSSSAPVTSETSSTSEAEPSETPSEAVPSPSETPAAPSPTESTASKEDTTSEEATTSETPAPSSTATASDGAFTQPAATEPAQTGPESSQQQLLDLHNNLRARFSAGPVTWNQDLADYAAGHANKCEFAHSGATTGENLAAGTGSGYDLAGEFQMWADEVHAYDFSKPGYSNTTGHFTQVVWKGTTQIGCAWKTCEPGKIFEAGFGNSMILVCEYEPRGNYVSSSSDEETAQWFSENVGPQA